MRVLHIAAALILMLSATTSAEAENKKIGDYIESYTYNSVNTTPRTMQYRPEGRAFMRQRQQQVHACPVWRLH